MRLLFAIASVISFATFAAIFVGALATSFAQPLPAPPPGYMTTNADGSMTYHTFAVARSGKRYFHLFGIWVSNTVCLR